MNLAIPMWKDYFKIFLGEITSEIARTSMYLVYTTPSR